MTGNNYNKKKISNSKSGQVLLITVMLLATVMTVTLALTFRSTTETQTTKLEEESQKALAAAEAGIEAVMKSNTGTTLQIGGLPGLTGFTGNATVGTKPSSLTTFVSPLLQKDQQYTFYFSTPDFTLNPPGFSSYWTGNLSINFKSETDNPSLELTFIDNSNNIHRYIIDPSNNLSDPLNLKLPTSPGSYNVDSVNFSYRTTINLTTTNNKLLIVRSLAGSTKIGLDGNGNNLRTQGKYVNSTATSQTGVTKKVQLFQSYPQIPAEFFVTSF